MNQEEAREPRVRPPYIGRGSALRPTPLLAPPPFEKLPEKGRSSLPTASRRVSTNRERAAPPLSFTPSAEKQAGKNPRTIGGFFLVSLLAFSTVSHAETVVTWPVEDGVRERA